MRFAERTTFFFNNATLNCSATNQFMFEYFSTRRFFFQAISRPNWNLCILKLDGRRHSKSDIWSDYMLPRFHRNYRRIESNTNSVVFTKGAYFHLIFRHNSFATRVRSVSAWKARRKEEIYAAKLVSPREGRTKKSLSGDLRGSRLGHVYGGLFKLERKKERGKRILRCKRREVQVADKRELFL